LSKIITSYFDGDIAVTVVGEEVQSSDADEVFRVCFCQISGKQFGILATFGPTYFN
jgi:hypothetical protein